MSNPKLGGENSNYFKNRYLLNHKHDHTSLKRKRKISQILFMLCIIYPCLKAAFKTYIDTDTQFCQQLNVQHSKQRTKYHANLLALVTKDATM